ncbi:hypothetical protein AB4Z22_35435, partial [Paenibacillus sp. TAF58]
EQRLIDGFISYKKSEIELLRLKKIEFREKYYSYSELVSKMPYYKVDVLKDARIRLTTLGRGVFNDKKQNHEYAYDKQVVEEYLNEEAIREEKISLLNNINYSDPLFAFKRQLEINKILPGSNNILTTECWLGYCYKKIAKTTEANHTTITSQIALFIKCTELILDGTQHLELHMQTGNQINLMLFNHTIPATYQRKMYVFLKEHELSLKSIGIQTKYSIKRITNPFNASPNPADKSIYSYEIFKDLLDFTNNTSIHKLKAIDDAKLILAGKDSTCYSSSWLYVLVHFNNAWRHTDIITNIPRIDLRGIPTDLDWYINNDLTEAQSN